MADIELVIKIDEKLYKDIYADAEIMIYGGMRSGKTLLATLLRAIRNGTPLPKGHGRLIDETKIKNCGWNFIGHHAKTDAPTIIEADKAESENEENGKVCCNCRHNKRYYDEGGMCYCECEVSGKWLGYVQVMTGWCRHWAKEKPKAESENEE